MGFWSRTGKIGKGIIEGVGSLSMGAGKGGLEFSRLVGTPTVNAARKAPLKFASALGVGVAAGALGADALGDDPKEGAMGIGVGAFAAASLGGSGLVNGLGATAVGAVARTGAVAGGIGSSLIKMPKGNVNLGNLSDIKIKGVGVAAIAAVGVLGGIMSAEKKFEQSRMGTNDGMVRSATPMLPMAQANTYSNPGSYAPESGGGYKPSSGGATGDLVFAMHNNR